MKQNVYDYSYQLRRQRKHRNLTVFFVILSVIIFLSITISFFLFPVYVRSDSMESAVANGGILFVSPVMKKNVERGDVVFITRNWEKNDNTFKKIVNTMVKLFTLQQVQLTESKKISGKPCLRRIMAIPGDKIYMKDYILYIQPGDRKQYLTEFELIEKKYDIHIYSVPVGWNEAGSIGNFNEITLGPNEYFVLADNRVEGTDSRIWGCVPQENIEGKAVLQYFPFKRIHRF